MHANQLYLPSLIIFQLLIGVESQIAFTELSKIGVIKAHSYSLKIKGNPTNQFIVLKFIPSFKTTLGCNLTALDEYKALLTRILTPIHNSINLTRSAVTTRVEGLRFWGAVVGGVALGVATSAQITAGIALHNSLQNANAIQSLKSSILATNNAIEKLQNAGQRTVIAISALQDQINTQIIPAINTLGCNVAQNSLKLSINQYFSEIALIFGPNLRNPSYETISIQVLSQAFNNDFESLLQKLGYSKSDLLDVMQSDSIRARIIDVDLNDYLLTLQIEYPDMITINEAIIQEFNVISYNQDGRELMTIFPRYILKRGNLISNIDLTDCVQTERSFICQQDTSSPISVSLFNCIGGKLDQCARSQVINSHVSRFALSDGVVFANCVPITCVCVTKDQYIVQDKYASNVMISSDFCKEVQIDGFYISVGTKQLNRTEFAGNITMGPIISTNPIDINSQLGQIENELEQSKDFLDQSRDILNRINPNIINNETIVYLIIVTVIVLIWLILLTVGIVYSIKSTKSLYHTQSLRYNTTPVNSLSSLIPSTG